MSIQLIHRGIFVGDEKFFSAERTSLALRQGVPTSPRLNEYFSLISDSEPRDVFALGMLTAEDGLAEISRVAVPPEHERKGYGSLIINHMEDFARASGIKRIKATTKTWGAFKVLKHCGYEELARIPLDIDLKQKKDFEGGPQYEILLLKNLRNG